MNELRRELRYAIAKAAMAVMDVPLDKPLEFRVAAIEERLGPLLSTADYFCSGSKDWESAVKRAGSAI